MRTFTRIVEELTNAKDIDALAKAIYVTAALALPRSMNALAAHLDLDKETVSRRCKILESKGWMKITKMGRSLVPNAAVPHEVEAILAIETRNLIQMSQYKGEATTRAFVDWLVSPGVKLVFGSRPAFLYNKATKQQLEYDIYAEERSWAMEHHGEQHFEPTPLYPDEKEFIERIKRDRLKMELSKQNNIRLSMVTKQDLTLERMLAAIPEDIPKRMVDPEGPYVKMLEKIGKELLGRHDWDRE